MRVFISYKSHAKPDCDLARTIFEALNAGHQPFLAEQSIRPTEDWSARIDHELDSCDFFIQLLTEHSVVSEMVTAELEKAYRFRKKRQRPAILPIRVAYDAELPYAVSGYLTNLQGLYWNRDSDTPQLIADVVACVSGGTGNMMDMQGGKPAPESSAPSPVAPLELPGGGASPDSKYYIERRVDRPAREAVKGSGVTMVIKGARQMGKSSLLNRLKQAAKAAGKESVFLDFSRIDDGSERDPVAFIRRFLRSIGRQLSLPDRTSEYWSDPDESVIDRSIRYVEDCILRSFAKPVTLAMDEVDSIFGSPAATPFFRMLRNWHNARGDNPLWMRLDIVLSVSTNPYLLIGKQSESPFNVATTFEVGDFTLSEVAKLNGLHGLPFSTEQSERLYRLIGGHPYLTRLAMYKVASGEISNEELLTDAVADSGPFDDHLQFFFQRIRDRADLVQGMREAIYRGVCSNPDAEWRLRGAGLVRLSGGKVVPRCELYAKYFARTLHV